MGKEVVSPLVSIICNTYNHVNYIRQCLDGFLMQETNFPIEILVHDDASTDGTADIVREYEDKYPDLIKPIYQTENQYSKGVKVSLKYQYARAKGKYIALCEGDDYWTDPLKLQKQVEFLENNTEYIICSHKYQYYYENNRRFGLVAPTVFSGGTFDLEYFILNVDWVVQPLSLLFRQSEVDWNEYARYKHSKDSTLAYFLLKKGKGYLLEDVMGVYRLHSGGVWSSVSRVEQLTSGITSFLGVCKCEKDITSARCLYNYICSRRCLGKRFLLKRWPLLIDSLFIILRYLGIRSMINCLISTITIR